MIIFKQGASLAETKLYDKRVYVLQNEKAWMTDNIFYTYMRYIGLILSPISGTKVLWMDNFGAHFGNETLLKTLKKEFDIALERGIANMTQFWQPADQFIIRLFKRYINDEIMEKIRQQEIKLHQFIAKCIN